MINVESISISEGFFLGTMPKGEQNMLGKGGLQKGPAIRPA